MMFLVVGSLDEVGWPLAMPCFLRKLQPDPGLGGVVCGDCDDENRPEGLIPFPYVGTVLSTSGQPFVIG